MHSKKRQQIYDRISGYFLLLFLSAIVIVVLGYLSWIFLLPQKIIIIQFPRIVNLKVQDPVKIRGVNVGSIIKIRNDNGLPLVFVEMIEPFSLYDDYSIFSKDRGIMGDRVINIMPGTLNRPPISLDDTLIGQFTESISGLLGRTNDLEILISGYMSTANQYLNGNDSIESVVTILKKFADKCNYFSVNVEKTIVEKIFTINSSLDQLALFTQNLKRYSADISINTDKYIPKIDSQVLEIGELIYDLSAAVDTSFETIKKIGKHSLLKRDDISLIITDLENIKIMLNDLLAGYLALRLKIIPNNFIE